MKPIELAALRRLLMFSTAEAARWVAADEDRPTGVEERTWNRWESGRVPVPRTIEKRMTELVTYRDKMARSMAKGLQDLWHATRQPLPLLWFSEVEDYPFAPVEWRPYCATVAHLYERSMVGDLRAELRLVVFDPGSYQRWRLALGLPDDVDSRLRWAEDLLAAPVPSRDQAA